MDSVILRSEILGRGAALVGFADLRGLAPDPFAELTQGISIAAQVSPEIVDDILAGPTREYRAEYDRVNALLNEIASQTVQQIRRANYRAEYFPATVRDSEKVDEYLRTLRVAFQHKTAATRAGLGWIGKCALLISRDFGPRIRLVTVFTDMPLEVGMPIEKGECGQCTVCVTACPAQALQGREWHQGVRREELVDVFACQDTGRRLMRERTGIEATLCGLCVAICPRGRKKENQNHTGGSRDE